MTATKHLIAMIQSHAAGDNDRFLAIAETIAADADKSGKTKVAGDIRGVVEWARRDSSIRPAKTPVPIASPRGELAGLIRASYPETSISDLVLNPDLTRRISGIVREHKDRHLLEARGLTARRKLLFSGPPGTGKGLTASVIAGELGLPLFTVLLDGVITKFLGETAAKLRLVFESMTTARGVYFFDEVDALASRRDSDNDVGEARRMLNSFLQFLEDDKSNSIIVAATNYKTLLDPAIFRRFHASFSYTNPGPEEARGVLERQLREFDSKGLKFEALAKEAKGLSQADLVAIADDAARNAVLDHDARVTTDLVMRAIVDRKALHNE